MHQDLWAIRMLRVLIHLGKLKANNGGEDKKDRGERSMWPAFIPWTGALGEEECTDPIWNLGVPESLWSVLDDTRDGWYCDPAKSLYVALPGTHCVDQAAS